MKPLRSQPLLPPLALYLVVSFASVAAPSHAAADAPARTLDWSQAAPRSPGSALATDSAGARGTAAADLPVLNRAVAPPVLPSADNKPAAHTATKRPAKSAARASKGLFALEDRAIIIVGGKNTTAGEVKRAIERELVAKAGAPKIVKGGARKLDLGAHAGAGPKPFPFGQKPIGAYLRPTATTSTASALQAAQTIRPGVTPSIAGNKEAVSLASLRCPDKGLPKISEVGGKLKAGGKASVSGQCFGDRPGRVEVIGQFPGGKLALAFTAWDPNTVELEIPATIRGAPDHTVSITVVTADGKASPAMQAQFVAARERVEVPERLWSPAADFDFSATAETSKLIDPNEANEAYAGHTVKTVRVQPQCALDTMDAIVHSGSISQIRGWEEGPPNEASVTIDWLGTCTDTKTTTSYYYGIVEGAQDISIKSACRVAYQARAWAYCPAGIAP